MTPGLVDDDELEEVKMRAKEGSSKSVGVYDKSKVERVAIMPSVFVG